MQIATFFWEGIHDGADPHTKGKLVFVSTQNCTCMKKKMYENDQIMFVFYSATFLQVKLVNWEAQIHVNGPPLI